MTESIEAAPALEGRFWRSRSAASIAGIIFAVLFITALVMIRLALGRDNLDCPDLGSLPPEVDQGQPESDAVRRHRIPLVHRGGP